MCYMKRKSRAFYTWNQTILCKYLPAYIYGTHVETRVTRSETLFVLSLSHVPFVWYSLLC